MASVVVNTLARVVHVPVGNKWHHSETHNQQGSPGRHQNPHSNRTKAESSDRSNALPHPSTLPGLAKTSTDHISEPSAPKTARPTSFRPSTGSDPPIEKNNATTLPAVAKLNFKVHAPLDHDSYGVCDAVDTITQNRHRQTLPHRHGTHRAEHDSHHAHHRVHHDLQNAHPNPRLNAPRSSSGFDGHGDFDVTASMPIMRVSHVQLSSRPVHIKPEVHLPELKPKVKHPATLSSLQTTLDKLQADETRHAAFHNHKTGINRLRFLARLLYHQPHHSEPAELPNDGDQHVESDPDSLFSRFASDRLKSGGPLMHFSDFQKLVHTVEGSHVPLKKLQSIFHARISMQVDMHEVYGMTHVEASKGLCSKTFKMCLHEACHKH